MKKLQKTRLKRRWRRHQRVRAKVKGTKTRPRLSVFRSLKHLYVQLIDDENGSTLLSASDQELEEKRIKDKDHRRAEIEKSTRVASAYEVGKLIAQKALSKGINQIVFDRGGYKYHGRVKAVAEGAREKGLKF